MFQVRPVQTEANQGGKAGVCYKYQFVVALSGKMSGEAKLLTTSAKDSGSEMGFEQAHNAHTAHSTHRFGGGREEPFRGWLEWLD